MRMHRGLMVFFAVFALACGATEANHDAHNGGATRVRLQGMVGTSGEGFVLDGQRVVVDGKNDPNVDFYLTMTMVVSLFPPTDAAGVCQMSAPGTTFASVEEIPLDEGACVSEWGPAYLFGNAPHDDSEAAGQGFLVKDRLGGTRGRLMMVSDFVREGSAAEPSLTEVVFDYLATPR
jgi:hypothetical protein